MTTQTQTHWWTTADALTAGSRLGDVVDGIFQPSVEVLHVTVVPGTTVCRIATTAGTLAVQRDALFYAFPPEVRPLILIRNITAGDLAMDMHSDDGGYSADDVIGTAGSVVHTTGNAENDLVEVTGFINDPYATGFVPADAVRAIPSIPAVTQ